MTSFLARFAGALAAAVLFVRPAHAAPPPPDLLARLSAHAQAFEDMRNRASYTMDGKIEELDGDGKIDSVKTMNAHVEADGTKRARFVVDHYTEGGEDKTGDARKKQADDAAKHDDKERRMPFLASEQARYTFDVVEVDASAPTRERIAFVPKEPADDTIEGSAWVDVPTGHVLTAGFKLSKPGRFVDFVHVTLQFGADTPLGPAVSFAAVEGKGGLLFYRKHFRGSASFHDYKICP